MNKSLIVRLTGLGLFILIFICAVFAVGELSWYIDFLCFILVAGLSVAYGLMCCKGEVNLLKVIKGIKTGALYAGGINVVIYINVTIQIMGVDFASTGNLILAALNSILYGLLLSAAARIAEIWLTPPNESN
jgi:hypothetical protein